MHCAYEVTCVPMFSQAHLFVQDIEAAPVTPCIYVHACKLAVIAA